MKKLLTLFLIICLLTSCASAGMEKSYNSASEMDLNKENSIQNSKDYTQKHSEDPNAYDESQKIISSYTLTFESKKYDEAVNFINSLIKKYKAYISEYNENNYSNRDSFFTIKVPQNSASAFIDELEKSDLLNSLGKNLNSEDVTKAYKDKELRLATEKDKLKRLNSLAEKENNMEVLLKIEDKITETIYTIESLESDLKNMDEKINYTSINIRLSEISANKIKSQNPDFLSRVREAFAGAFSSFINFCSNLIITLIYLLPYILILGLVIFILKKSKFKFKFLKRKNKERNIDQKIDK